MGKLNYLDYNDAPSEVKKFISQCCLILFESGYEVDNLNREVHLLNALQDACAHLGGKVSLSIEYHGKVNLNPCMEN